MNGLDPGPPGIEPSPLEAGSARFTSGWEAQARKDVNAKSTVRASGISWDFTASLAMRALLARNCSDQKACCGVDCSTASEAQFEIVLRV
jgi:hypothetical protein